MAAPFICDEKVTIEHDIGGRGGRHNAHVEQWVPLLSRYWANVQDELPSRAESVENGREKCVRRSRLRMQGASAVTGKMRAVLHSRGDLIMQIIAGPALLDDRVHYEFRLESYE